MSLELDEVVQIVLHSNSCTDSKHAPKTYHKWKVLYAKQPTPNQLPTNSPVQFKNNSHENRGELQQTWCIEA
jgi:hypothetical protein